jgi:hypothetical protein
MGVSLTVTFSRIDVNLRGFRDDGQDLFFHNPKAGGSSLKRIFESLFPPEKQCPLIENDKVDHERLRGDYARFRGFHLYAGHYGYDIFAAVYEGHSYTTNFRHPAARLISLYNFFRFGVNLSDDDLLTERFYAVLFGQTVSFQRFVSGEDPRVAVYVCNAHFRQLSRSCWSLETANKFDEVCRFIDGMHWYFVCKYPELSVRWMRDFFHWEIDQMQRENVTEDQSGQATKLPILDDQTFEMISRNNNLDFDIYKYAVDRFLENTIRPPTRGGLL